MVVDVCRSFFLLPSLSLAWCFVPAGRVLPLLWPVSCPGHQLLFEHHRMARRAHDVVPDLGKPPWAERAPSNG